MIERERRFLVGELPDPLPEPVAIVQAYLTTEPVSTRIRRAGARFVFTLKAGTGMARTEIERAITSDEFDELWPHAQALRITKRRYHIALASGGVAELDLFDGDLAGRQLVEVEFASDAAAAAFDPPSWFGREITNDGRFTNAALARHGWPDQAD